MKNSVKVLTSLNVNLRKRHPLKFVRFLHWYSVNIIILCCDTIPSRADVNKNVFGLSLISVPKYALLSEIRNKMVMFKTRG